MIQAENLSKHFGATQAVNGLSLTVPDGKITGLLGPNGSGKSTTMRMLAGLLCPDVGRVLVNGVDVALAGAEARSHLGVVPDTRGLYTRLTARENIAYFGELRGMKHTQVATRIHQLAKELDFEDLLDRRTEGFSQGQRVKVTIARAMIGDPTNLMLDEPSNGLDVMSTRALREFLLRQREEGKAILLSTHIMQEVVALCDHIIIVAEGAVRAEGTADSLKQQAGCDSLEDAFVQLLGTDEGLMA
jgi:sodium transport system ATP-binding protein